MKKTFTPSLVGNIRWIFARLLGLAIEIIFVILILHSSLAFTYQLLIITAIICYAIYDLYRKNSQRIRQISLSDKVLIINCGARTTEFSLDDYDITATTIKHTYSGIPAGSERLINFEKLDGTSQNKYTVNNFTKSEFNQIMNAINLTYTQIEKQNNPINSPMQQSTNYSDHTMDVTLSFDYTEVNKSNTGIAIGVALVFALISTLIVYFVEPNFIIIAVLTGVIIFIIIFSTIFSINKNGRVRTNQMLYQFQTDKNNMYIFSAPSGTSKIHPDAIAKVTAYPLGYDTVQRVVYFYLTSGESFSFYFGKGNNTKGSNAGKQFENNYQELLHFLSIDLGERFQLLYS